MLNSLVKKYNSLRKRKMLNNPLFSTKKKYAFIGAGIHGLSNLYPVLSHFNITLKYICTNSGKEYSALKKNFPGCIFTNNIHYLLNDAEVEAVFVCSDPQTHFGIVSMLAKAGKKIFVEKPPCQTPEELETLLKITDLNICKVGLQRRYWAGNKYIFKKIKSAKSYTYKFLLGTYPNGNPYTELFIHALDYCSFLFGRFTIASFSKQEYEGGLTVQIHAVHDNGITALIEMSTHFSWNNPSDVLTISCSEEIITAQYPVSVKGTKKPARFLNLPTERVLSQPETIKEYFSTGNLVMPVKEMNTLVLQGFYKELETFILLAESENNVWDANDLKGLTDLYKILHTLQQ
ncbi:hypothetical protein DC498_00505 [Terrimonas sp.]|uniref:Gfo/Idh/MocA family protein n=1 Tax=Terrimonas sp. TaxID=1914338 RepID=UPI000D518565|nr:Gfo/Idh/MocA family oxidoreductase [Terrimonas sp.]PVD53913.1 hypothetical protein DC498_00505 [Terrimonas sp.]